MDINQIKKLIKKVGGVLVMDGEEPSFVMLSYDNYNDLNGEQIERQTNEETVPVAIRNEANLYIGQSEYSTELVSDQVGDFGGVEAVEDPIDDEARIQRLNTEISLLKEEIKQKEIEMFLGHSE